MDSGDRLTARIAHLNMIQGVIARMANNSASLKNYCLVIIGALIAFSSDHPDWRVLIGALAIIFMAAWMDAKYLQQERAFRDIYIKAADPAAEPDFAMNIGDVLKSAEYKGSGAKNSALQIMKTWSVAWFYGALAAVMLALALLTHLSDEKPSPSAVLTSPPPAATTPRP